MKANQPLTVSIDIRDREGRVVGSKQVVTYAGLLARAHEDGLRAITTDLIQAPTKANGEVAIVRATVITSKGAFTGIGDANPENVNRRVVGHLVRLAETRAKSRALRDAVNIGMVSLDELDVADDDDVESATATPQRKGARPESPPTSTAMTEAQRRMLFRLATQRGVAPENARNWIMAQLGVADVRAISRRDASQLIERLHAGENGVANGAVSQ